MIKNKPIFMMLVGLPGSGKSTFAKQFENFKVHSSDAIREELTGDINNQDLNSKVFETLHKRVKKDLTSGYNVIYDATNINWKRRKAFLQELNKISCNKVCKVIATPFEVCINQNETRDRVVPIEVLDRMYKNFDIPYYNEGWDDIELVYLKEEYKTLYGRWSDFIENVIDLDQHNKHHTLTLGEHCQKCLQYVREKLCDRDDSLQKAFPKYAELLMAAAIHDNGKPYTMTYINKKGEQTEEAHYYEHEHVGCYDAMNYCLSASFAKNEIDKLDVCALIRWHMIMHFQKDWNVKTIDKYEKEFTENKYLKKIKFYEMLHILHEGDRFAH